MAAASVMMTNAISQANALSSLASSLVAPTITPTFASGPSTPAIATTTQPTLISYTWSVPTLPNPINATLNVDPYLPDPFDGTPPVLSFGAAPATFSETAPTAPGITYPAFPTDPTVSLPAPPSLLSLSISQFAGVNMPTLTEDTPVLSIVDPQPFAYVAGTGFTSDLLTQTINLISSRLQGGTGLPSAVEYAIWDRGRSREAKTLGDAQADLDRMESLGYALPPGVWLDSRIKLQREYAEQSYGFSREVMIKQAELEQENLKTSLAQAIELESKLIDQYNQVEQRVLEGVKYATESGIATYNAKVEAYKAYVQAYQTKVEIYKAQIQGELAKVEAYKAAVEAESAKAQINTALVNQFKVQTDAALATIELFKAELSAVQTKAEIEKLKIEIYGEQVKAFGAKINAYTAQVEGYKATVQGEATKQQAYATTVEAYSAEVAAQAKIIDAKIAEYKGKLEAKQLEYEGYKAAVSAEAERVKGIASTNEAVAEMYKATVQGTASYNDALTKQWSAVFEQAQRTAEIANSVAKMNAELYVSSRGIAADVSKASGAVFAQLGAAALNALNWQTQYSVHNSAQNEEGSRTDYNYNYSGSI
jgi:hypothetical protein